MYFSPRSQQPQPKCFSTSALGYSEGIRRCLFIQEPRTGIGNCLFFGSILDIHKPPRDEAKQTRGNLYKEMYSLFDTGGQLAICGMGVQFLLIPGYLGGMLSLSFSTGNLHRGENHWACLFGPLFTPCMFVWGHHLPNHGCEIHCRHNRKNLIPLHSKHTIYHSF